MSEQQDTNRRHPIPGGEVDGLATVHLSACITDISSCAYVGQDERGRIRFYLGDLMLSLPVETWRPIIAALNAALAEADGTQPVSIPDNLDALMAAIEDAEALDGAL